MTYLIGLSVTVRTFSTTCRAMAGVACASNTAQQSSPTMTPVFGSEIFCVLHAAVGAARAKRGNTVRGVAREQHPTTAKRLHTQAGKCIDATPFQLELDL